MKCMKCGAEMDQDTKVCTQCGASTENQEQQEGTSEIKQTAQGPNKKFTRILTIVVAVLAVVSVGALAFVKLTAKDPKEVVISAFENIWTEDQVLPSEELFGLKAFADSALTSDTETGFTLKMDSCSDPTVNQYAGSGLRTEVKNDRTNLKSSANLGVIYNGMDLISMNAYGSSETLMLTVPELSKRVFTVDLDDGLVDRVKNSPIIGPMLEQSGVDVEGFAAYLTELVEEAEQAEEEGKTPFDMKALMDRYKEGCEAQENFKAALTVEKAEKGTWMMNGKEVSCKGYNVIISKASMIEFLETSSEFFLQDEELREDFLNQMESTVRMTELMGGSASGVYIPSAKEMQEQSYDQLKTVTEDMVDFLDTTLTDIQMTVYVDKDGNLAAMEGTTQLYPETLVGEAQEYIDVTFSLELQGGSYLTQNFVGNITLENEGETVETDILRQGSYDGKMLTDDISVDFSLTGEACNFAYTNTYNSDDGSYHTSFELGGQGSQFIKVSMNGVLDELEKGESFHMDIDALEIAAMDNMFNVVLSGEYYYGPLSGEITPLEGEALDILAADESGWSEVGLEIISNGLPLLDQLGINLF